MNNIYKNIRWYIPGILLFLSACSPKTTGPAQIISGSRQSMEKSYYFTEALKQDALGDKNTANALYLQAIKTDPGCDACYYKLADLYLMAGYLRQAHYFSAQAVQLDSANLWYRLQLAKVLTLGKEYDKALHQLDVIGQQLGNNEEILLLRYELLLHTGKEEEATEVLRTLSLFTANPRIYSILGESYGNLSKDSLSLHYYKEALSLDPEYVPALFGEMDTYRRMKSFDVFFQQLYTVSGNEAVPTEMKTEYLSALMKVPQFSQVFGAQLDTVFSILRARPDSLVEPLYGGFLIQTGQSDSALHVFRNAAQTYKNNSGLWQTFLGFIYYRQSWDSLQIYASEAMELFPQQVNFITLKAIALWQQEEVRPAIELLEKSLPLSKRDTVQTVQTCALLGDLYQQLNDNKKAYKYYDRVLELDSNNISVLNNYAYYLSLEGKQLNKAYKMSRKVITAEPNNATYLDTFGWILYKMGKEIEAKAIFKHAMIYGGTDSAVILDHYGDVLNALGEKDAAIVYWEMSYRKEANPEVKKKIQ